MMKKRGFGEGTWRGGEGCMIHVYGEPEKGHMELHPLEIRLKFENNEDKPKNSGRRESKEEEKKQKKRDSNTRKEEQMERKNRGTEGNIGNEKSKGNKYLSLPPRATKSTNIYIYIYIY